MSEKPEIKCKYCHKNITESEVKGRYGDGTIGCKKCESEINACHRQACEKHGIEIQDNSWWE